MLSILVIDKKAGKRKNIIDVNYNSLEIEKAAKKYLSKNKRKLINYTVMEMQVKKY